MSVDRRGGLAAAGSTAARASSLTRIPSAARPAPAMYTAAATPTPATRSSYHSTAAAASPISRLPFSSGSRESDRVRSASPSPGLLQLGTRGRTSEVDRDAGGAGRTAAVRSSSLSAASGAARPSSSNASQLSNGAQKRAPSPAAASRAGSTLTPARRPSVDSGMYGLHRSGSAATAAATAGVPSSSALRPVVASRSGLAAATFASSRQGPVRAFGTVATPAAPMQQTNGSPAMVTKRVAVTRAAEPNEQPSSHQHQLQLQPHTHHASPAPSISHRSAPGTDPAGSRRSSLSSSTSTANLFEAARAAADARAAERHSATTTTTTHSRHSSGVYSSIGTNGTPATAAATASIYPYASLQAPPSSSSSAASMQPHHPQQNGFATASAHPHPTSSANLQHAYSSAMAQAQAQSQTHSSYALHSASLSPAQPSARRVALAHLPPPVSPMSSNSSISSPTSAAAGGGISIGGMSSMSSTPHGSGQYAPYSNGFHSAAAAAGAGGGGGATVAASAAQRVASISGHFANTDIQNGVPLMANGAAATAPAPTASAPAHAGDRDSSRRATGSSTGLTPRSPDSISSRSISRRSSVSAFSTPAMRSAAALGYGAHDAVTSDEESMEFEAAYANPRRPMDSLARAGSLGRSSAATPAANPPPSSSSGGANGLSSSAPHWSGGSTKRMRGLVGLANLGNTCFLNSTLQCLLSTPGLLQYFATGRWEDDVNTKAAKTRGALAKAFGSLAHRMATAADGSVERPSAVKSAVSIIDSKFLGYGQHDSHEFTRVLLSALHDDVNRIRVKPPYVEIKDGEHDDDRVKADRWWRNYTERNESIVTECFAGQMQSTLVCQTCHHQSEAFDPFMDLSLPIPKASTAGGLSSALARLSPFSSSSSSSSGGGKFPSLLDCFSEFLREELMSGHEQVYCRQCKAHRDQTKRFRIYRWPRVLVVHLKRFSYGAHTRAKLNTDVEFPMELDCRKMQHQHQHQQQAMGGKQEAPAIYNLYGVSNHMGSTGGGHYTAHCKVADAPSAPFYTFNDSSVYPIATQAVKGPAAYVLFYARAG